MNFISSRSPVLYQLIFIITLACQGLFAQQPNFVFLFADDLGIGDLSCYGHPYSKTPNLDQLAREGTKFWQVYAPGNVCNPSRTGFMTGRHPNSFANSTLVHGLQDRTTVTELLNDAGYTTGHFGKWHIGGDWYKGIDDSARYPNGTYGIDELGISLGPWDYVHADDPDGRDRNIYDAAIQFIEENKDTPFYINVWGHATHAPVDPNPVLAAEFSDVVVDRNDFGDHMNEVFDNIESVGGDINVGMRNFLGDVYGLDSSVGKLLQKLDELGLRENTVVVFSSDQGPARSNKEIVTGVDPNMSGYSRGFRAGKHSNHEGGLSIPFIVRWPGHVPAGKVNKTSLFSGLDFLPTVCSIAGVSYNPAMYDGEDVSDVWFGGDRSRTNPLFWWWAGRTVIQDNWKLTYPSSAAGGITALFDLSVDPEERTDVTSLYPDVRTKMDALLTAWAGTVNSSQNTDPGVLLNDPVQAPTIIARADIPSGRRTLAANVAPRVTSTPVLTAEAGLPYSYVMQAEDPEGNVISFSSVSIPAWLSFDPDTGILTGTPMVSDIGSAPVVLSASDAQDSRTHSFNITVSPFSPPANRPNFIFIISDDQSHDSVGFNNSDVITPSLDSLANEGMTFTQCHNMGSYAGAICVASRAMLLTGKHVWQAENAVGSQTLWAEHFENAGYDTFVSGKWHVYGGGLSETESAVKAFSMARALGKGFYESPTQYFRPALNPTWSADDTSLTGHWSPEVWDITNSVLSSPYTVNTHTTELYANNAINFLNSQTVGSDPFFMYIAFNAPHDPRQAPTEYLNMYNGFNPVIPPNIMPIYPYELGDTRDNDTSSYPITEDSYKLHLKEHYAMITHMDHHIGRIMAALEASGKADNTYVVFTSDHGIGMGQHGFMGKQILLEHSARMPFIIKGPGINGGDVRNTPFYMQSIYPTTLELAEIPVPANVDFPSVKPIIDGADSKIYESIYGGIFADERPQRMIKNDRYKLMMYPFLNEYFLYDLENDPWETTNLILEDGYGEIANDLYEEFLDWHAEIADPYPMPFIDFSEVLVDDSQTYKINYSGQWTHTARDQAIQNTISSSGETNASAELIFEGSDVRVYTKLGKGGGIFDIYLDGNIVKTFDSYSGSAVDQVLCFEQKGLPSTTHSLRIVNTGRKNPASDNYNINLDMIAFNKSDNAVEETNTTGGTSSSQHAPISSDYSVDNLFDGSTGSAFATSNNSAWVDFQFPGAQRYNMKSYSVTSARNAIYVPGNNLVANASFENGTTSPNSWTLTGSQGTAEWVTNRVHSGTRALRYPTRNANMMTTQNVTITPNTDYEISVWVYVQSLTSGRFGKVTFDTNDVFDATGQGEFVINSGAFMGQWTKYTGQFNSANETNLTLRIFSNNTFEGVVYFDDVSVREINANSDPSSWTLYGSNDGSTWLKIDQQNNIVFPARGLSMEFSIPENNYSFEYYRLDASNTGSQGLHFAELDFYGDIATAQTPNAQPNIIYMMADDLGKEWVSCYGADNFSTPNIDALAANGIKFDNAYSMPICTPSRITLFTGKYPYKTGWVGHWDVPRWGVAYYDWKESKNKTVAQLMKDIGYKTFSAGKWQINDFRLEPMAMEKHGFDDWCMWTGGEGGNPVSDQRYWDPYINTRAEGSRAYPGEFGPDIYNQAILDFIALNKDDPMFVYYPMCLPHTPFTTTPDDLTASSDLQKHKAMVLYMDKMVGQVVAAVDALGLLNNTIIFYTTDNGSTASITGSRNGVIVPGGKGKYLETGHNAPFVVSGPGRVPTGVVSDALTDFSDLLPTFLDIGGAGVPTGFESDGVSIKPVLYGQAVDSGRDWIMSMGDGHQIIDAWGLGGTNDYTKRSLRNKRYHVVVGNNGSIIELYDLQLDPQESTNQVNSSAPEHVNALSLFNSYIQGMPVKDARPFYKHRAANAWDTVYEKVEGHQFQN